MTCEKQSDWSQTLSGFMLPIVYKNGDQLVVFGSSGAQLIILTILAQPGRLPRELI